jgi:hypothetical protein
MSETPSPENPIPDCPYDDEPCQMEQMHEMFNKHVEYMGTLPVCRVCAIHKQVRALQLLRYVS